jgi:hypothetical protein
MDRSKWRSMKKCIKEKDAEEKNKERKEGRKELLQR